MDEGKAGDSPTVEVNQKYGGSAYHGGYGPGGGAGAGAGMFIITEFVSLLKRLSV